ncbi:hypothetical protein F53441_11990 [Fusarium austroafricanum]|uniref:Ubiquitin-like domain-containing protein n=1 Tax=Fusarium austroafricanum TaxID=2364996 RepID=A0A8H4NRI7_9HYPO|nr:hypothetical protein F53441_11990 [Fusarium austroafricanum]
MAEAVGLAASLIGLLTTAYKLSRTIYGAVDSISSAPVHIKAVSSDTKAMFSVLGTLSSYLDDEDNAMGVLHRVVAADLGEVLTNSISVLKELHILVGEFIKCESRGQNVGKWNSLRLHFKETEVKQWREQLVAHKITLSVAISMANLSTEMATKRIEAEVLKLKSMVTGLLIRMNATEEIRADHDVIIDNYKSTIRRVARGADSIVSEATWDRETVGPSLSVAVSSTRLSEETDGSYKTARSIVTVKPNTTFDEHSLHDAADFSHIIRGVDEEIDRGRSIGVLSEQKIRDNNENSPVNKSGTGGPHRLFVKGPDQRTRALTFECAPSVDEILTSVQHRSGIPPKDISLRMGGRILTATKAPLDIADGTTLHANFNVTGIGWDLGTRDDDDILNGSSLSDLPWYTVNRLKREQPAAIHRERNYWDGSFRLSVQWYDEKELRTQQQALCIPHSRIAEDHRKGRHDQGRYTHLGFRAMGFA